MDWNRTWVVASGPSAKVVDFDRLRGRGVLLGVNEVPLHIQCDAMFSLDRSWVTSVRHKIQRLKGCEVHLCESKKYFKWPPINGTIEWGRVLGPPSFEPRTLSSGIKGAGCSGLTAINLAAQMGAKEIYLFGFDMIEGNYGFWFKEGVQHVKYAIPEIIESFRQAAPFYKERGIDIYNVNPDSAVDAFPKIIQSSVYS